MSERRESGAVPVEAYRVDGGAMQRPGPCAFGRRLKSGVLCFADWHSEFRESRRNRHGYGFRAEWCAFYCGRRPDIVEVKLEATDIGRGHNEMVQASDLCF